MIFSLIPFSLFARYDTLFLLPLGIFYYIRLDLGLHPDGEGCLTAKLAPSELPLELLQTLPGVVVRQTASNCCDTRRPLLLQVSRWLLVLSGHPARIFVSIDQLKFPDF